jgi:O-antigen/teichoic acid export membrane protein
MSRTKQAAYLIFSGLLSQVSAFLMAVILARKLTIVDYGTYRQFILVSTLIVPILSSALPVSLLYFIPRLNTIEEKIALVRRTILLLFCVGIVATIGMISFSHPVSKLFNNSALRMHLILGSLYPALILGSSFLGPFLIAVGQARLSAIYSSITAFSSLLLVSVVALVMGNLTSIIIAILASSVFSFIFSLYIANKQLKIFTISGKQSVALKEQLYFVAPIGLASAVSILGLRMDQAIVSSYFDVTTYAIYSVGAMELHLVGIISTSIYSVLFPEVARLMAENKKDEVLRLWQRAVEKAVLVILPIFGIAMIVSYHFITTLYSKKYEASVPLFQICLFLIPVRSINFGLLLKAAGKTKYDFYGSILFLAINLVLILLTIKPLGIYGATLSMVISVYILAIYLLIQIKKEIGFKISETLNMKNNSIIILLTTIPIVISGILRSSLSYESMITAVAALLSYALLISISYIGLGKWRKLQI